MDSSDADQRLEHHRQPPEFVSLDHLFAVTGVEYFKVKKFAIRINEKHTRSADNKDLAELSKLHETEQYLISRTLFYIINCKMYYI